MMTAKNEKREDKSVWVGEQVEQVKPLLRGILPDLQAILEASLRQAATQLGFSAIVQGRTKDIRSFAEKCLRKDYKRPAFTMTDLCGVRIILESKDQIEPVCRFIRAHFEIDEANSEDVSSRLKAQEFGYQSHHFIVSLRPGVSYGKCGVLEEGHPLLERRDGVEADEQELPPGPVFKAEIQVRTLLQHAWAAIIHDNLYKTDLRHKPRHLERESGKIASLLEDADDSFVRLLNGLDEFKSSHGAYLTKDEMLQEIDILKTVQAHDPDNPEVAHEIGRLAVALYDWELARDVLWPFRETGSPALRRDLGWALWRLGEKEIARQLVIEAVGADRGDPENADGFCVLGDIYFEEKDFHSALSQYRTAFELDSSYPRTIGSYLKCQIIVKHKLDFIPMMEPHLERAIAMSRQKIRHGVHLPWAWYDVGFFRLLLGDTYGSLSAYAQAVDRSPTTKPLEDTLEVLDRIQDEADNHGGPLAQSIKTVRCFLALAASAMVLKKARDDGEVAPWDRVDSYLRRMERGQANHSGVGGCPSPVADCFQPEQTQVIVAGGCDTAFQSSIDDFRHLIEVAFEDFAGTIISGGTTAGISGIVGDLANPEQKFRRVAFLPDNMPPEDPLHPNYHCLKTGGEIYGPQDPIQVWVALLKCRVHPADIKLLGINGGSLSRFEFQLALVMGAQVGLCVESGRAATAMCKDPDWSRFRNLLALPTDMEIARSFIMPLPTLREIPEEIREALAEDVHDRYREDRKDTHLKEIKEMADWNELSDDSKEANRGQVDGIEALFDRFGFKLVPVESAEERVFNFADHPGLLDAMAEAEHGRWTAQKLRGGWVLGPKKDDEKRTHPCLVAWHDLSEALKDQDRNPIADWPARLARHGLAIEPK
jgi:ppGpp synthetase/RelA/SpoT-type nucleotidyltranferase